MAKRFTDEEKIYVVKSDMLFRDVATTAMDVGRKEEDIYRARRTKWYELLEKALKPIDDITNRCEVFTILLDPNLPFMEDEVVDEILGIQKK